MKRLLCIVFLILSGGNLNTRYVEGLFPVRSRHFTSKNFRRQQLLFLDNSDAGAGTAVDAAVDVGKTTAAFQVAVETAQEAMKNISPAEDVINSHSAAAASDQSRSPVTADSAASVDSKQSTMELEVRAMTRQVQLLKEKRQQRQIQLLAADVAINKAEAELNYLKAGRRSNSNLTLSKGTYDYGFVSKSAGSAITGNSTFGSGSVPPGAIVLAFDNFKRELINLLSDSFTGKRRKEKERRARQLRLQQFYELNAEQVQLQQPQDQQQQRQHQQHQWQQQQQLVNAESINDEVFFDEARAKLDQLTLSNAAIWARERARPAVRAPWVIKAPYLLLCWSLDLLFSEREPIQRFYFLETVARMPYFSYISMLHMYETLGWWRRSVEAKRVHFAEEYNEYHHLLIWEGLGGDQEWRVRFFAQHAAVVYFYVLIVMWAISPSLAYNFSELIEAHAVDTYAEFAESNKELLQSMEAPPVAKSYYEAPDLYIFDEFQTKRAKGSRRPQVDSLYDVVCNIRDDEAEHVNTMAQCQDPAVVVRSPNTEAALLALAATATVVALLLSSGGGGDATGTGDAIQQWLDAQKSIGQIDIDSSALDAALSAGGDAMTAAASAAATAAAAAAKGANSEALQRTEELAKEARNPLLIDQLIKLLQKIRL